jgi:hypothetical protein
MGPINWLIEDKTGDSFVIDLSELDDDEVLDSGITSGGDSGQWIDDVSPGNPDN